MKPVLMIHNVVEGIFDLPLDQYILTFDDGYADHYNTYKLFQAVPTKKIYFITTSYIGQPNYISIPQLVEMYNSGCVFGGHSHSHANVDDINGTYSKIQHINDDTRKMLKWFDDVLSIKPTKYCFPYNRQFSPLHLATLRRFGFTEFYGRERIPIETLLHNQN